VSRRLGKPDEHQQDQEAQMDAEFNPKNPACRDGPISHSGFSATTILYI
jgi:hypothetical protein